MECQKRLLEAISLASEHASEVGTQLCHVKHLFLIFVAHSILSDRHTRQIHRESRWKL